MTITNRQYMQREACRKYLMEALKAEMKNRNDRGYDIWVLAERMAVLNAANRWIVKHTDSPILTVFQVEKVESMAVGHSDYAHKFVLYVSELIYN